MYVYIFSCKTLALRVVSILNLKKIKQSFILPIGSGTFDFFPLLSFLPDDIGSHWLDHRGRKKAPMVECSTVVEALWSVNLSPLDLHLCFWTHLRQSLLQQEAADTTAGRRRAVNPCLRAQPALQAHLTPLLGIIPPTAWVQSVEAELSAAAGGLQGDWWAHKGCAGERWCLLCH